MNKNYAKSLSAHFVMERDIIADLNPDEEIFIRDPKELKRKILAIRSDGKEMLNILSDFDCTLTKKTHNNKRADHSFNAIEKVCSPLTVQEEIVGKEFVDSCSKARAKYLPIEIDPNIPKEEKDKHMADWFKVTQTLLKGLKVTKNEIRVKFEFKQQKAVSLSRLYLRNGCHELLKIITDANLKLHIVSAGIKAVVTESFHILQNQRELKLDENLVYCMTPEVYDIAQGNVLVDFGEPTILSTNKHLYINHAKYPEIQEGSNAILMGDLIEDYQIVKNLKLKQVIGIGFLNAPAEYKPEALERFLETYDIVIAHDGNLIHVAELIKSIIGLEIDEEYTSYQNAGKLVDVLKA